MQKKEERGKTEQKRIKADEERSRQTGKNEHWWRRADAQGRAMRRHGRKNSRKGVQVHKKEQSGYREENTAE